MMICAFLPAVLMALAGCPPADDPTTIAGTASVIDADTIEIHGQRIRLFGVDAPEARQPCTLQDGKTWRCGVDASNALSDWIGRNPVTCTEVEIDRWQRTIATCTVRGDDLGSWLVREGWSVAYRQYSLIYVSAEDEARAAGRGIWESEFDMPWDWRRAQRQ